MLFIEDGKLVFHFDAERMILEAWGRDSLRVRATRLAEMPGDDWALIAPQENPAARIELQDGYAVIQNGKIRAQVYADGKILFRNQDGKILLEEFLRNRKPGNVKRDDGRRGFASALSLEAREFTPHPGGDYALTARFEAAEEERIYGMGQYQQPYLNLKGCELELAHRNSQASVPFAVSSLGYGFLWNNPAIGRVSFARNVTTWTAQSTKKLDYWITAGDAPADIMENYAAATGAVPMMPDWAMGFWQCKLRYQTQEELLGVAREYHRRGVPLSVIVIDYFHWPRQGEWKFDPDYWPDPQAMVDELSGLGVKLMVSVWPTVDEAGENYREMLEKGYLIRTERGHRISLTCHGHTIHYDATHPGARDFLWSRIKKNYYQYGIQLFWLDEAEPEYTYYHFDHFRYHLGPNVQIGNLYPAMYAKTFYDGMAAEGQENIINLLRCAWAGSQRYGALVWSGDIDSSFRSLRNQFAAGLNMGLSGIPWWTTDIGGFHGGNAEDPEFRECFTRWFQYGAFCPVMRLHGVREPHTPPLGVSGGGECGSGAPNEIWSYGEDVYAICKDFIEIRERMKPYVKRLMADAHGKGAPVMRPLFYDFPADPACWQVEDQYMFGPSLLVAPILYSGQREREVTLPIGARWTNAWTGETFDGGRTVAEAAPIERIPLFLRDGADVGIR